jgi:hypothetical protein
LGEANRRRASRTIKKQPSITAGWHAYLELVVPPQAPDIQREECRLAFWAGAATLFYAIMQSLDPGAEPTEADVARLDAINAEIEAFSATFDAEVQKRLGGRQQ